MTSFKYNDKTHPNDPRRGVHIPLGESLPLCQNHNRLPLENGTGREGIGIPGHI